MKYLCHLLFLAGTVARCLLAQPGAPTKLTLQDAEALALKNHPRVQAAQYTQSAMNQRIDETRSAYYPCWPAMLPGRRRIRGRASARAYLNDPTSSIANGRASCSAS